MTPLRPAEVARRIGCDEEEAENALRMLQQWGESGSDAGFGGGCGT